MRTGEVSGWQPFETAPKDGTEFLLWVREKRGFEFNAGITKYYDDMNVFYNPTYRFSEFTPIAWHPLPPPYRSEGA